jgi:RNA polymerase sigma factor (sigma-70 family)
LGSPVGDGTTPTDAELLRCLAAGTPGAIEILYRRYWPYLMDFVRQQSRTLNEHAAEDIASESLWRLCQDKSRLKAVTSLRAYLKAIAKNLLARRFRVRRPCETELSPEVAAAAPSPRDALERSEVAHQIAQALDLLADSRRLALTASQEGLSAKQIAASMGCTENAARILVQKARRELARLLSRCGDSCTLGKHGQDQCPARTSNFLCLKSLYYRQLRL